MLKSTSPIPSGGSSQLPAFGFADANDGFTFDGLINPGQSLPQQPPAQSPIDPALLNPVATVQPSVPSQLANLTFSNTHGFPFGGSTTTQQPLDQSRLDPALFNLGANVQPGVPSQLPNLSFANTNNGYAFGARPAINGGNVVSGMSGGQASPQPQHKAPNHRRTQYGSVDLNSAPRPWGTGSDPVPTTDTSPAIGADSSDNHYTDNSKSKRGKR